jgi:uncharacterized protein (TIGR02147 family)
MNESAYIKYIRKELSNRIEKNSRYSLRAFAAALKVNVGTLSQVLAGKRELTFKMAQEIMPKLSLTPMEESRFMESLIKATKKRGLQRVHPDLKKMILQPERLKPTELTLDVFHVIADWYHYAILDLPYLKDFKSDANWIAKRLGISLTEATMAIQRLCSLELMEWKNGKLIKTNGALTTADKSVTTSALKKRQKQILQKSIESLEKDSIEIRNHSAMTMAICSHKIPEAKKRIEAFLLEMSSFLEDGEQDRMYEMTINLFPLDKA